MRKLVLLGMSLAILSLIAISNSNDSDQAMISRIEPVETKSFKSELVEKPVKETEVSGIEKSEKLHHNPWLQRQKERQTPMMLDKNEKK